MFFIHELSRVISLHPSFFGPRIRENLTSQLIEDVEGLCNGSYYIITVVDTIFISEGRILPGSALAQFTILYRAVVWRPFKGETVDGVVNGVNAQGFFVEVGPLKVFVSSHLVPPEIKFDANATPAQYTDNEQITIESGTHVRLKLLNTRSDVNTMFAIGSVKEDFLGMLETVA